jgi:hypothetical protein
MLSVVNRNVVLRRIPVYYLLEMRFHDIGTWRPAILSKFSCFSQTSLANVKTDDRLLPHTCQLIIHQSFHHSPIILSLDVI